MERSVLAHIGLGANVGAAREALERALVELDARPGNELVGVSRLYRTRPVGPVAQADFLNAVAALRVPPGDTPAAGAMELLVSLKGLEQELGRLPRLRWGPREVDLDLLLFGDARVHVERAAAARSVDRARDGVQWLDVPHVSAAERSFVLAPLSDLAPDLVPPGWDATVAQMRDRAAAIEGRDAVAVVGEWDERARRWRDPTSGPMIA